MAWFGFGKKKKRDPSDSYSVIDGSEDEYDAIYGGEPIGDIPPYVVDEYGFNLPGYEEVYDESGSYVPCDGYNCNAKVKFHNGQYKCPKCGKIFDRADFFNYIGANPPGPECVTCDNQYPGCIVCPYGYETDEF